jgi:S1-C subfamily serine protease
MAGPDGGITADARAHRPWKSRYGRALLAGAAAAAFAATAVIFFLMGSAGRPDALPTARPTAPSKSPERLTVAQIYATLAPSVVSIKATGRATASGTGVIVNADGGILTAHHVIEDAASVEVTFADGTSSEAIVVAEAPEMDIALLMPMKLPAVVVPAVLGASRGLSVGDEVVAIGNQLGLAGSTTSGVVSGLNRSIADGDESPDLKGLIQFDAAVNPGSSGGPLVNARGETVGIVVALANPTDAGTFIGVGFAVPIGQAIGAGASRPPQI